MKECQIDFYKNSRMCDDNKCIFYLCKIEKVCIKIYIAENPDIINTDAYKKKLEEGIIEGCNELCCNA